MRATRLDPRRRGLVQADDLGPEVAPTFADHLDRARVPRDGRHHEDLPAIRAGDAGASRKIRVFDRHREGRRLEAGQQAGRFLDGEADDVIVIPLETPDKGVADVLNGVGPGLVQVVVPVEIGLDHLVGQRAECHIRHLVAGEEAVFGFAEEREPRDHPVPPA